MKKQPTLEDVLILYKQIGYQETSDGGSSFPLYNCLVCKTTLVKDNLLKHYLEIHYKKDEVK